eukprot:7343214-Prymnesium_polylepis.1
MGMQRLTIAAALALTGCDALALTGAVRAPMPLRSVPAARVAHLVMEVRARGSTKHLRLDPPSSQKLVSALPWQAEEPVEPVEPEPVFEPVVEPVAETAPEPVEGAAEEVAEEESPPPPPMADASFEMPPLEEEA